MRTATLTITDPGNIWLASNDWMDITKCEGYLLFMLAILGHQPSSLVFGPFDNNGETLKGMKPWDQETREIWKTLAEGASKQNSTELDVWYRYVNLNP